MDDNISTIIIADGFFSNNLPSEFNSKNLASKIDKIDVSKDKLSNKGVNKWSKLIQYSIPKKNEFRRVASIPHPLHYLILSKIIEKNWVELENHNEKSKVSLSSLVHSGNELTQKYSMNKKQEIRLENLAFNKYILCVDINRYYPSIYTHSISWALHTKVVAKEKIRDNNLLGNKLDTVIRNMQDGQTMGIPIGPITSSIIQEIIGSSIDVEFQRQMCTEIPGFRYTDDMEYYFNSFDEANKALSIITKILKRYNLDLNVEKTKIYKIPLEIESSWINYFKTFKFRNSKDQEKQEKLQKVDLIEFFNQMYKYKLEINDPGMMKYALKVIRNRIISKSNWDLFQSLLFQTALVDSTAIPLVMEIIESYKYKGYELNLDKIGIFFHSIIYEHINLNNDYEIIWLLSFASKLEIVINKKVTNMLSKYENALVNIMVMILNDKGLMDQSIEFRYYEKFLINNDLYDENWMFLYECCRNNWLGKEIDMLNNDAFFKQLKQNDISFVISDYSSVKEDLKDIICHGWEKEYKKDPNVEVEQVLECVIDDLQFTLEEKFKDSIITEIHEKFIEGEKESDIGVGIESELNLDSWTKLFLTSKMKNKQIYYDFDDEY